MTNRKGYEEKVFVTSCIVVVFGRKDRHSKPTTNFNHDYYAEIRIKYRPNVNICRYSYATLVGLVVLTTNGLLRLSFAMCSPRNYRQVLLCYGVA
jgi:hypothetical protein